MTHRRTKVVPIPPQTKHHARPHTVRQACLAHCLYTCLTIATNINVFCIIRQIQSNTETEKGLTSHSTHRSLSLRQVFPVKCFYWYSQPNQQFVRLALEPHTQTETLTALPVRSQMNWATAHRFDCFSSSSYFISY